MNEKRFVFFSRKRWLKIKIASLLTVFSAAGFLYLAYLGFTQSPFAPVFAEESVKKIVDSISIKNPEKIEIEGSGPILNLDQKSSNYGLRRSNPFKTSEKVAILTFDDGPDPVYTRAILDILEKEKIKGSFLLLGKTPIVIRKCLRK